MSYESKTLSAFSYWLAGVVIGTIATEPSLEYALEGELSPEELVEAKKLARATKRVWVTEYRTDPPRLILEEQVLDQNPPPLLEPISLIM